VNNLPKVVARPKVEPATDEWHVYSNARLGGFLFLPAYINLGEKCFVKSTVIVGMSSSTEKKRPRFSKHLKMKLGKDRKTTELMKIRKKFTRILIFETS